MGYYYKGQEVRRSYNLCRVVKQLFDECKEAEVRPDNIVCIKGKKVEIAERCCIGAKSLMRILEKLEKLSILDHVKTYSINGYVLIYIKVDCLNEFYDEILVRR